MGQGRNAIYLAPQGWKVTGIDISDEGIRITKQRLRDGPARGDVQGNDQVVRRAALSARSLR
jgi:2-polyprenyl-3-methyl-5-hydroxy-6-metoxy-1,4-benzoquinol methylase